ncbi:MAG: hypothetical protein COB09_19035 [Thalassobium sp.]|nr:MAG: hypothetical protein COB09_19035 [Thalassobium sp.]
MNQGLDELVEAGFLKAEKSDNPHSDAITWKPTERMLCERTWLEKDFVMKNANFKIIDESRVKT